MKGRGKMKNVCKKHEMKKLHNEKYLCCIKCRKVFNKENIERSIGRIGIKIQ